MTRLCYQIWSVLVRYYLMKTLTSEKVYLWEYCSLADVQKRLPYFSEQVYKWKQLHSSLGYKPPDEFEELLLNQSTQTLVW